MASTSACRTPGTSVEAAKVVDGTSREALLDTYHAERLSKVPRAPNEDLAASTQRLVRTLKARQEVSAHHEHERWFDDPPDSSILTTDDRGAARTVDRHCKRASRRPTGSHSPDGGP
jgi:hypothetical protein